MAENLRHAVRWLVRIMDGIELIELTPELIHRQQAQRHDRDYRIMLSICDIILRRRLPTEHDGQNYFSQAERERLVLHQVYERFVANFFFHHLSDWEIKRQTPLPWHETSDSSYLPIMRPDILLTERSTKRIIVLDTKFTPNSLIKNRWGKEMFDSSHLYQIYAYIKTQDHLSEYFRRATGILLYPTIQTPLSEKIELQDHQIHIEGVDLAAPWENIETRLLDLVNFD